MHFRKASNNKYSLRYGRKYVVQYMQQQNFLFEAMSLHRFLRELKAIQNAHIPPTNIAITKKRSRSKNNEK
jgi:hypothetical protein